MRWQRVAQAAIAVFVIGFIALLVTTLRRERAAPVQQAPPERSKPDAPLENPGGGKYRVMDPSGKQQWVIDFGNHIAHADGRQEFGGGVTVTINRGDRQFTIRSGSADVTPASEGVKQAIFRENVRLQGTGGLEVRAAEATYSQADDTIRIPGQVEFSKGRTTGSGFDATYDQGRDVFWMRRDARVDVAPGPDGAGALHATAKAIGIARQDHYLRLEGNGRIEGEGRTAEADDITIHLTDDDARVSVLELRGNSRITGTTGSAQAMSARDIDMAYAEDGRTLKQAELVENAVVQLPGSGTGPGKRITARTIDLRMAPDGSTVSGLTAKDRVQVDLPAEGSAPAKHICAASLNADGGEAGLQTATFAGGVEYNETSATCGNAGAVGRSAQSRTLVVETDPGFGAIRKADFRGNVTFTDGPDFVAEAQQGIYDIAADRLDLMPAAGQPGPASPTVTDGNVSVAARTIQFGLSTREMSAETRVRSTIRPRKESKDSGRVPSMLAQDEPVNVTSNRLSYKGRDSAAVYTGDVTLWQGADTTIKGPVVTIDDRNGNLAASGGVTTSFIIQDAGTKAEKGKRQTTIGSAESFTYDDAKRLATYTGKANLRGPQGDVTGEKIELFLEPATNQLRRAEAYGANGAVVVREGNRIAKGSHMTYTAADDRYLMIGAPVEIVEEKNGTCTQTLGSTVTFNRTTESASVEGSASGKVQMQINTLKSCPAGLIR